MMKIKNILMMMAAGGLLGGCAEVDDQAPAKDPVAITLTATVEGETALPGNVAAWTRADADGSGQASHESQICLDFTPKADAPSLGVAAGSSQSGNAAITGSAFAEGSTPGVSSAATAGSAPAGTRSVGIQETSIANGQTVYLWADKGSAGTYAFLQAWELTSNGSGSLSGGTKYYPSDGAGLTFRAVHGNFASAPTSSTAVSTALSHSIDADQSASGKYERSDLMYGEGTGSWQSAGTVAFTHKLSKIEVNLTPGIGITASDIASAVVKVRKVKPTVSVTPSDGTVGSASGTATDVTARRTGTLFEAVIPAQDAPDGVLTVTINGITAAIPNAVAAFTSGNKYIYNVTCTNKDKRLNPLWYVAENNVKSYNSSTKVVTLETNPAAGSSQFYNWTDAMAYFSKQGTSYDEYWAGDITDGSTEFKYHLPCQKELLSILPCNSNVFSTNFSSGSSSKGCVFGYNSTTQGGITDNSYWSDYSTTDLRYAIRFLGTPYCSVWRYQISGTLMTITAKLIDFIAVGDASLPSKLSSYMSKGDSWWNSNDENEGAIQRKFYRVGYRVGSGTSAQYDEGSTCYFWSTKESTSDAAYRLSCASNFLVVDGYYKIYGFSVRLFRNTGVGVERVDPGVALSSNSIQIGWVIADNGKAYSYGSLAKGNCHTPKAVVCYIGAAGSADASSNTYRGLAMSLIHPANSIWGTKGQDSGLPDCNTAQAVVNNMSGIANTNTLRAKYPSSTAALAYGASFATGVSNWFLPSTGQWIKVFNQNGANITSSSNNGSSGYMATAEIEITVFTNLNNALKNAGGELLQNTYCLTSTEYNNDFSTGLYFSNEQGIYVGYVDKSSSRPHRAFCAF